MCICLHIYVYIYLHICIHIHIYIYIYIYTCMYAYVYMYLPETLPLSIVSCLSSFVSCLSSLGLCLSACVCRPLSLTVYTCTFFVAFGNASEHTSLRMLSMLFRPTKQCLNANTSPRTQAVCSLLQCVAYRLHRLHTATGYTCRHIASHTRAVLMCVKVLMCVSIAYPAYHP